MNKIEMTEHIFINWRGDKTFIHALIAFHLAIASSIAFPLIQLIFFHVYLHQKQMTTYDWVVERELAQNEKELEKQKKMKCKTKNKYMKADDASTNNTENATESSYKYCCSCTRKSTENEMNDLKEDLDLEKQASEINTNFDVKLSGLSSGISTNDMKSAQMAALDEEIE